MRQMMFLLFLLLASPALAGGQPADERKAQESLPQSTDQLWKKLAGCKVKLDPASYRYSITPSAEVKALAGKDMTLSGFIMPLDAEERFSHFLLSKRTPTCPFCPPGEPNEIVEVFTDKPIAYDEKLVRVKGRFGFTNNAELGLFFRLKPAKLLPAGTN